jgi:hypothetical protein
MMSGMSERKIKGKSLILVVKTESSLIYSDDDDDDHVVIRVWSNSYGLNIILCNSLNGISNYIYRLT